MKACVFSVALLVGLVGLGSCGLTGKSYVERSVGYSVTRGTVVRVDNLATERNEHLADGVAIKVSQRGCRVSMRMGQPTQVIDMKPGSFIVFTETDDYVLQPYSGSGQKAGAPGASWPSNVQSSIHSASSTLKNETSLPVMGPPRLSD